MKKTTTLITALLLALGTSLAAAPSFAHPADCGGPMMGERGPAPRGERMAERMKQRQQQLHDSLKLSPEQEKAWAKFQESRPFGPDAQRPDPAEFAKLSAPERAEKMLERMKQHEGTMAQHVSAMKSFYDQLNADQKKTFDAHFMAGGPRGPREGRGMRGPGPGPAPAPAQ